MTIASAAALRRVGGRSRLYTGMPCIVAQLLPLLPFEFVRAVKEDVVGAARTLLPFHVVGALNFGASVVCWWS